MILYDLFFEYDQNLAKKAFEALKKERESKAVGYYFLPDESLPLTDVSFDKPYDTIVVIGIGGSSLGTKAIYSALHQKSKKMIFLENPDPLELSEKFASIEPENSLIFVISKSGTTIETLSIFKAFITHFNLSIDANERLFIITDPNSPLHQFADEHNLKVFNIPKNVGGRFSVLSAVGIVPLTLAGIDTKGLLDGARAFLYSFFEGNEEHLLYKASLFAKQKYPINVLFSYGTFLEHFTKWYVQLWAESLGKSKNNQQIGLTPVGLIGSVDQHSFLQLIIEGPRDKTVTFLKIKDFQNDLFIPNLHLDYLQKSDFVNGRSFNELLNGECDATKEAILAQGIPTDTIEMEQLDEESLGELIIYYELLTSAVGALLGINTYNQPGVELGKEILRQKFVKKS